MAKPPLYQQILSHAQRTCAASCTTASLGAGKLRPVAACVAACVAAAATTAAAALPPPPPCAACAFLASASRLRTIAGRLATARTASALACAASSPWLYSACAWKGERYNS